MAMVLCRMEKDAYPVVYGEGLENTDAFNDAENNAEFEANSDCSITFWKMEKLTKVSVVFEAKVVESPF